MFTDDLEALQITFKCSQSRLPVPACAHCVQWQGWWTCHKNTETDS